MTAAARQLPPAAPVYDWTTPSQGGRYRCPTCGRWALRRAYLRPSPHTCYVHAEAEVAGRLVPTDACTVPAGTDGRYRCPQCQHEVRVACVHGRLVFRDHQRLKRGRCPGSGTPPSELGGTPP